MLKPNLIALFLLLFVCATTNAQQDSTLEALQQIPLKYISSIDSKVDKYSKRITSKTTKTLEKLSHWENKIKSTLEKISPEAAARLFNNGQLTFTSLLQQIQQGEAIALQYQQQYEKYRDDLTTGLKYIEQQRETLDSSVIKKVTTTRKKMQDLNEEEDKNAAIQQFIRERKGQLIAETFKYLGQNKYLSKISKESWYFFETAKNYKELFQDEKKAEQTAKMILNKIPAFTEFLKRNSMLAGLFDIPGENAVLQPGMQTRAGVQELIQGRLTAMGPGAQDMMHKNLQAAQAQMNDLKTRLGNGYSNGEMPPGRVNQEKTKTFSQRLEYGFNMQFSKNDGLIPSATDIAVSIGYKPRNGVLIGLAGSYKLGIGTIDNIRFSNEGIGIRSFADIKWKKQLYITGGFEMNYNEHFKDVAFIKDNNLWQRSALLGITKKFKLKTKFTKGTNIAVLYDFLSRQHIPVSKSVIVRIGYNL
jgi:hypothetical protein